MQYNIFAKLNSTSVEFDIYNINNATTGAIQFTWNWGDGSSNNTTTNKGILQHTYQAVGSYFISHTINHQCGDTTIIKIVHIYPSVKALINPLPAEICLSDSILLKSNSDTTLQTFWKINTLINATGYPSHRTWPG